MFTVAPVVSAEKVLEPGEYSKARTPPLNQSTLPQSPKPVPKAPISSPAVELTGELANLIAKLKKPSRRDPNPSPIAALSSAPHIAGLASIAAPARIATPAPKVE